MTTCPYCGTEEALISIGDRIDYPRRWLRWASSITHIYSCSVCGEVVEVSEVKGRGKKS